MKYKLRCPNCHAEVAGSLAAIMHRCEPAWRFAAGWERTFGKRDTKPGDAPKFGDADKPSG